MLSLVGAAFYCGWTGKGVGIQPSKWFFPYLCLPYCHAASRLGVDRDLACLSVAATLGRWVWSQNCLLFWQAASRETFPQVPLAFSPHLGSVSLSIEALGSHPHWSLAYLIYLSSALAQIIHTQRMGSRARSYSQAMSGFHYSHPRKSYLRTGTNCRW